MNACQKGKRGERELANYLKSEHGIDARRGQQFCGGGDSPDVVTNIKGLHIECKRVERLNMRDAVAQAEGDAAGKDWIVAHRWNNGQWLVTVKLDHYFNLRRLAVKDDYEATVPVG